MNEKTEMTPYDGEVLVEAIRQGVVTPEDYPGDENEAFRLLIRSLRSSLED